MSEINELFGISDSAMVNDGVIMPLIEDPLKLSQGIGIISNNPSASPVGSPSTDLFVINTPLSLTAFAEQSSVVPLPLSLTPNLSNTTSTSFDPITGMAGDQPLIGLLSKDEITPSLLSVSFKTQETNITQQQTTISSESVETNNPPRLNQLTPEILERFRSEAIARWASAGITPGEQGILKEVQLAIADLPSLKLGLTSGNVVTIDQDAAGAGWFIDSSPSDDVEFSNIVSASQLQSIESDLAFGRVDLLTVMTHEFGHVLGLDHLDTNQVMSEALAIGTRHLPIQSILEISKADEPINEALELNLPTISAINGTVNGDLSTTDIINPTRSGRYSDDYQLIDFTIGKLVTLDLSSSNFYTYLQLINVGTGQVISSTSNSPLRFTPVDGINYVVRTTSYYSGETGTYTLIAASGAPDLVVTAATAPSSAPERSTISLIWTISNQGEAVATDYWYDSVYLSDNTIFDYSDRYIGNLQAGSQIPLAPGATYTSTQDMALPQQVGAGKQYLLFVADGNNNIIESSETNNVRAVAIDITVPDLVVTGATAPIAVTVGSSAEVSWTVLNQGNVQATHSWYDRIYLSNDQTLDGSDTWVSEFESGTAGMPLTEGNTYNLTQTVTISNTSLGSRYLLFVADADNNQYETNEGNNIKAIPVEVNAPDLIVSDASVPTTTALGEEITVNWQVTNQGSVSAGADWYDYFVLSDDQILDDSDDYIGYKWMSDETPLASNSNYNATENIIIPSYVKGGNRYLLFVVDQDNHQGESNENNNVKAVPISIKAADLLVSSVIAPTSANPGESIDVSWTVKNQGDVSATNDWYDYVFLSYDPVYDSSDTYLIDFYNSTALAPDSTYTVNRNVTLPSQGIGSPGMRYLLFVTHIYNDQRETNEGNNVLAVPLTINGENSDLVVTTAIAPNTAVVGQQIQIEWSVKNQGAVATSRYDWYDAVYLSSKPTFDNSAVYLTDSYSGSYNSYQPLVSGANYTVTENITLPSNVNGNQYLLFVADGYNYLDEFDNTNNVKAVPIKINAPDLVVSNATAPVRAYAGAQIEASWTVQNQGNGVALTQWYDSVYLSDDDTLSTDNDILLKDVQPQKLLPLDSGTGYTVTQLLSLPNTVTKGSKYLLFLANRGNRQGESNENNNVKAVSISIVDPEPNLPLLQTGSPVQNQNSPELPTNPNTATYIPLPSSSTTGLLGEYYLFGNNVTTFPDFSTLEPTYTKVDQQVSFNFENKNFAGIPGLTNNFAVRWTGKINIPTAGDITFYVSKDYYSYSGNRLYIDGQLVINTQGSYQEEASQVINLTSGEHDLRLEFFDNYHRYDSYGSGVNLSYTPVGSSKQLIPTSVLTPTSVTPPENLADLKISGVTAPTIITKGQTINTTWTVTNQSSNITQSRWYDNIYLSDDLILDSTDTLITGFTADTDLAGGST
ncbi:MAG: CARDB domain-containing protein [Nostoc sp. DedSLP03]|uniref:CARDB domain-containing protein n=1 Tax=Nostoc sp. DedSLP03 TaxID=3075400 RepID=UPI002AD2DF34|nr:CARDB domain-containing protein [Nostoc sp. DedSLP03]MDZ7970726.1 CARDB domain-containing protein [Nostoc sp. DedSLP03]